MIPALNRKFSDLCCVAYDPAEQIMHPKSRY
jgi:hypothetical protein